MGGGGSEVNSVDYGYNARMADIAEAQQGWAKEYFDMWQTDFKPYESAQAKTNYENLPLENSLYRDQLTTLRDLIPEETALYKDQLAGIKANLPAENALYKKQLGAASQFVDASTKGVDVNERMGLATADVSNAWKGVTEANARNNARMGVNANSGRFQGTQAALQTQQATQLAGARTQARVGAEQENYDRLAKGASMQLNMKQPYEPSTLLKGIGFLAQ